MSAGVTAFVLNHAGHLFLAEPLNRPLTDDDLRWAPGKAIGDSSRIAQHLDLEGIAWPRQKVHERSMASTNADDAGHRYGDHCAQHDKKVRRESQPQGVWKT